MPQNWPVYAKNDNFPRAVTPKLARGDNSKYGGAPQLMLDNNPMKFEDSRSKGDAVRRAAKLVGFQAKFHVIRGHNSKNRRRR